MQTRLLSFSMSLSLLSSPVAVVHSGLHSGAPSEAPRVCAFVLWVRVSDTQSGVTGLSHKQDMREVRGWTRWPSPDRPPSELCWARNPAFG